MAVASHFFLVSTLAGVPFVSGAVPSTVTLRDAVPSQQATRAITDRRLKVGPATMMIAIDPPLKSRTKLGAALRAHRARAVAAGMKMLSSEELDAQFRMLRR